MGWQPGTKGTTNLGYNWGMDTSPEQNLHAYLSDTDPLAEETETKGIPTGDDAEAAKVFRELGYTEAEIEANAATAHRERAKISTWEESVNEPLQKRALFLRSRLEAWARAERESSDGKRKSFKTPFGSVSTKEAQPKWVIDPETFLKWAFEYAPQYVEIKSSPKLAEAKKTFVASGTEAIEPVSGEAVPGITIEPPAEPFTYTIKTS